MPGYTIPNLPASPTAMQTAQSELYSADLDVMNASELGTGVVTGCAVTGNSNLVPSVAYGVVRSNGQQIVVAAGTVTITTADATNPRIDLIVVSSAGTKTVRTGTAAAAPVMASLTAGDVVLAQVYVPATATSLTTSNIVDKRMMLAYGLGWYNAKDYGVMGDARELTDGVTTTSSTAFTSATAAFTQADVGKFISIILTPASTGVVGVVHTTTVASVTNATTIVLTAATPGSPVGGSGKTFTVGTDDTTAIGTFMTAVRAATGVAYFPPGVYLTSLPAWHGSNVWMRGAGMDMTTLRLLPKVYAAANNNYVGVSVISPFADNLTNLQVSDLTVDHSQAYTGLNLASSASGSPSPLTIYGGSMALDIRLAARVVIERVRIINALKYSSFTMSCTDSRISGCYVLTGQAANGIHDQQDAIHTTNCQRLIISNNFADTGTGTCGDDAIVVRSTGGGANVSSDISIVGNVMSAAQHGVSLYCDQTPTRNISVTGNTVWASRNSGVVMGFYNTFTSGGLFSNVTIAGNTFKNICSNSGHGIDIQNISGNDGFNNLTITGNSIDGSLQSGGGVISVNRGNGLVISSNVMTNVHNSTGIGFFNGAGINPVHNFVIANNRLDMTAAATGTIGIVLGSCASGIVTGNEIVGASQSNSHGLYLTSDATNIVRDIIVSSNRVDAMVNGITNVNNGSNPTSNYYIANDLDNCTTPYNGILGTNTLLHAGALDLGGGTGTISSGAITQESVRVAKTLYAPVAGSALASSTTETALVTGNSFAANTVRVGQVLRIRAYGVYSTFSSGALTLRIKWGSTVLGATAGTTISSVTNQGWFMEFMVVVVSLGGSGTFECQGWVQVSDTNTHGGVWQMVNTAVVTVDTTAVKVLTVTGQWSVSNAANSVRCRVFTLESLN